MSRYIDADELKRIKFHPLPYPHIIPTDCEPESYKRGWNDAIDAIVDNEPTADVRENVNGNLVNIEPSLMLIDAIPGPSGGALLSMDKACSKCKTPIPPNLCNDVWFKYCPFCGAEMRGDNNV